MGLKIKLPSFRNNTQKLQSEISRTNELYRALYDMVQTTLPLTKDSDMKKYVSEGFEGNSDTFGILMKIATKFAQVPYKLVKIQRNGKEVEIVDNDILPLLNKPNHFQNRFEFMMGWALFKYVTGNAIVYAPKLEAGMNQGRVNKDGIFLMPAQNMEIVSNTWRKPIAYYQFDLNIREKIAASDVWHERFPSLNYEDGRNFMGMSPIKTALNIINMQNAGMETASKLYKGGHPPGILSKEDETGNTAAEQESAFRKKWKSKYQKDISIPVFTMGKIDYTQIGYSNLKDLEMLEMDKHGTRKLCNVLGVPSQLFNDTEGSTYNNMLEAKKAMFEDRIIPDLDQFWQGVNEKILPAYGERLKLKADYENIEALQEDKEKKAKVYQIGMDVGAYSPNEFREKMGDEPIKDPAMDERYIAVNKAPIGGQEEPNPAEADKFMRDRNLENGY